MSKKFKSQASSARAASAGPFFGFGSSAANFQTSTSLLSYVTEQPDLTGISQPNVVVDFKNLGKKDSTTKAKALEDLTEQLFTANGANAAIEDTAIEAWVSVHAISVV